MQDAITEIIAAEKPGAIKKRRRTKTCNCTSRLSGLLLPGLAAQLRSLCMKLIVKQGKHPSKGFTVWNSRFH